MDPLSSRIRFSTPFDLSRGKANNLAPYTVHGVALDTDIQLKLNEFARTLESSTLAGSIVSVVLAGSYARGDAAVSVRAGCHARATSDFDVYIITRRRISSLVFGAFIGELAVMAARSSERFRVDLHALSLAELRSVPPVIRYVDLRMHGKLLAGEDVQHEMPMLSTNDLPAYEGFRRMVNGVFFFFEKAADGEPDCDLLAYLYAEAASAFAIAVGAHARGLAAILPAIENSRFGSRLRSEVHSFADKLSSAWAWRWGYQCTAPRLHVWETALRDYVTMIDVYAECTWGCRLSNRNPMDSALESDAGALRAIAREALAPYARWAIRRWTGIDFACDGVPMRLTSSLYQVLTNVPAVMGSRNAGLPAASDPRVHHGLKIYWAGRNLLERVSSLGRGFASKPEVATDVERFMRRFENYFLGDARIRTIIEFGRNR